LAHDPQATLENLLAQMDDTPSLRPQLLEQLLAAQVYVLLDDTPSTLAEPDGLILRFWAKADGTPILPLFSSLALLQTAVAENDVQHVKIAAKKLFHQINDHWLALNPRSAHGLEFSPAEVARLRKGNLYGQMQATSLAGEMALAPPETIPFRLIEALHSLYGGLKSVHRAYITALHSLADDQIHVVIGILGVGDLEAPLQQVGMFANEMLNEHEIIDLVMLDPGKGGIHAFLLSGEPFYDHLD
jgi:hypothetical protein